jgi:hypothetical protein
LPPRRLPPVSAAGQSDRLTIKERLHDLVDRMSDEEAEATLRRIDAKRTAPVLRFLDAIPETVSRYEAYQGTG